MNQWKLTKANELQKEDVPLTEALGLTRKVRITKVMITGLDGEFFSGAVKMNYPRVLGRFAVGLIVDDVNGSPLMKGQRVLLPTFPPVPDTGVQSKTFSEEEYKVCGFNRDGYLRDFVYAEEDSLVVIPEALPDEKALLAQFMGLAIETADTLDIQRGEHIAVIGKSILSLFLCQFLIYRQTAPILIDTNEDRLAYARASGIYYCVANDKSLVENVAAITGGRLADGTVFLCPEDAEGGALPFGVTKTGGKVVFSGFLTSSIPASLDLAFKKRLSLFGVSDGSESIPTALNLLVNDAIDLSRIRFTRLPFERADEAFRALADEKESNSNVTILEMI